MKKKRRSQCLSAYCRTAQYFLFLIIFMYILGRENGVLSKVASSKFRKNSYLSIILFDSLTLNFIDFIEYPK